MQAREIVPGATLTYLIKVLTKVSVVCATFVHTQFYAHGDSVKLPIQQQSILKYNQSNRLTTTPFVMQDLKSHLIQVDGK